MNDRFAKSAIPAARTIEAPTTAHAEEKSAAPTRFVPDTLDDVQRIARLFYYSGLMKKSFYYDVSPDGVKSAIAGITVMIMYGAELGLSPMQAMRSMHVIEGQSSLSAEGCVAILKRSPKCLYFRVTSESDAHCTAETVRVENDGSKSPVHKLTVKIWWNDPKDIPEATPGLLYVLPTYDKKGNLAPAWARTPGRMVKARCTMWLAHNVYEDVVLGLYSVEEVIDFADRRTPERIADDIFSMVDMQPSRPGRVEASDDEPAPAVDVGGVITGRTAVDERAAGEVREAANVTSAKQAPTRAEWIALVEQIKTVGEQATADQLEAMKAEFLRFDKPEGREKRCELWNANEVLRGFWVAS
jgi:hypothetical protein